MSQPMVTVLMPVYNGERFLAEAIDSILTQTFTNFEFLIINDGSSDNSATILKTYQKKDARIKAITHKSNLGIVKTLNEGIEKSAGRYIARMDSDDISHPERLQRQYDFLEANPNVAVCASRVRIINEQGAELGDWINDKLAISEEAIQLLLPRKNCLAHPSTMIRSEIIKQLKYREFQPKAEDYDLWLRIASSGARIHKIASKLLDYRDVSTSITGLNNEREIRRTLINTRMRYIKDKAPILNKFDLSVLKSTILDYAFASGLTKPYLFLKKLASITPALLSFTRQMKKLNATSLNRPSLVVILPQLKIGGAERMTISAFSQFESTHCVCYVTTEDSSDDVWEQRFESISSGIFKLHDLKFYRLKKLFFARMIKVLSPRSVVVTTTKTGYKLATERKEIANYQLFDIIHGEGGVHENSGMLPLAAQYDKYFDRHIVVTDRLKRILSAEQYAVDAKKIVVIKNCLESNQAFDRKNRKKTGSLSIAWIGRIDSEKRPEHVVDIASILLSRGMRNFVFNVIGDGPLSDELDELARESNVQNHVHLQGASEDVDSWLQKSDLLLITSETESLPVVALEAMRCQVPIFSSKVGGMSEVVNTKYGNGLLFTYDRKFTTSVAHSIKRYSNDKPALNLMGKRGYQTLQEKFNPSAMQTAYRKVIK